MGAKELIGLLSNELRSGEHGLARIEPILFAASQLPEIIECGLPTPARVRAGLRAAASRNGELPSSRSTAWLILERDFLEIRFFTPSPFACLTPQGQPGPLWEESHGPGATRGDWGVTRAPNDTTETHLAGFDCRVPLDSINARHLTLRGEQGRFAQEERARPLLFSEWCCLSWAYASPCVSPLLVKIRRDLENQIRGLLKNLGLQRIPVVWKHSLNA